LAVVEANNVLRKVLQSGNGLLMGQGGVRGWFEWGARGEEEQPCRATWKMERN